MKVATEEDFFSILSRELNDPNIVRFLNKPNDIISPMIKDLDDGKFVVIGFGYIINSHHISDLEDLISKYPKFNNLIQPLLNQSEYEKGTGEIKFTLNNGIIDVSILSGNNAMISKCNLTKGDFIEFMHLTKDIAGFMNDNGNESLNF